MDRATPKVPYPRQLTKKETLDSLSHWQTSVKNYFKRFPYYAQYFKRTCTWTKANDNYGFTGNEAAEKADNLETLLDTLAGFLPGPYITHKITSTSTSIQTVWDIIFTHYGVKPSASSFLDYDDIKWSKEDRYIDLYDKLVYHTVSHLCQTGTNGGTDAGGTLTQPDTLTLSHRNHIAMDWLRRIDPALVKIVKLEYNKDLKSGTPLSALVNDIAENIDAMLHRNKTSASVNMVTTSPTTDPDPQLHMPDPSVLRISSFPYRPRTPMANPRGFQSRHQVRQPPPTQSYSRPYQSNNHKPFCQPCYQLGKKLNLHVSHSHTPQQCPQASSVRHLHAQDEAPVDQPEEYNQGENDIFNKTQFTPETSYFQTQVPMKDTSTTCPSSIQPTWLETMETHIRKIESKVRKEKSPMLKMSINSCTVYPTIDEGSEINVIDSNFANSANIPYSRTNHNATAAGSHSMSVSGETTENVVLHKQHNNSLIRFNLGKCIVVNNLGCPILIGEPGKKDNKISTDPSDKKINTIDINGSIISLPYESNSTLFNRSFICRLQADHVVYPGDSLDINIPAMLQTEKAVIFTPRYPSLKSQSLQDQVCKVEGNLINIVNTSHLPVKIEKNTHFGDLIPPSIDKPINPGSYAKLNTHQVHKVEDIKTATVDPDNILSPEWKSHFTNILLDFNDIITPIPGCYNGFYGNIDCSINFIQPPPASNKARLPSYPHEKLVKMAEFMDQMESWGVLKKPHELGITPKNVHTSYLVPKSEGNYRFVTDFSSLLPFIGKVEVLSPTIAQAKRVLSSFKYFVELDLSHCFWQGPLSAQDSAYLATPHPFGGLRCYARVPQGIRNASEQNSERLSIIYGDLEQSKRMTRMADGIYVGGDTLKDLSTNLIEVFTRARNCGLTFKPSKIVVCPVSTILFGWKKTGSFWSPTNHVISPLSTSPPPKTVKQLRGWIGAYRQVSDTIKDHSITLTTLEKETAGRKSRDEIKWSPALLKDFDQAKSSLKTSQSISIPNPSDILHIYPDFSQTANAVGGHLVIERSVNGEKKRLNGGYFSTRLDPSQSRWTPCEKETLGIKLNIEHFKPFIRESNQTTIIHPDNMISVHAWNRLKKGIISSSSKVAAFLSCLSENNIDIKHCPGINTKVADFGSRNPPSCSETRCQICKYMSDQCQIGENCVVNNISVQDIMSGKVRAPLTEKPAWLHIQKKDDTHNKLFKLITSGGLQPERKLKNHTDLKLMYNMYTKGILKLDPSGLIVIKHVDPSSGHEYDAISVPRSLYPSILQSLHIRLNHPSRTQMHRFAQRYFHCIGSSSTVDDMHRSCQVCTSLSIMPTPVTSFSTEENKVFGSSFSADVLISDNQKIFLCREKLSQYTTTKIISDESADTLRQVILESVLPLAPSSGAKVQVDAAPGLQSIAQSLTSLISDDILQKHAITIDIGRIHNPNKNPIAENAIKEFRKERLKINPRGGSISETELILITNNMNLRIRNRGFSAKEMFLRRDLINNKPVSIQDSDLSENQSKLRNQTNTKHNMNVQDTDEKFNVGDRVFLKRDLSKLHAREEFIITSLFSKTGDSWAILNKIENQFRKREYTVKLQEIMKVSTNFSKQIPTPSDPDPDIQSFQGFPSQQKSQSPTKLEEIIVSMQSEIPKQRGRPKFKHHEYSVSRIVNKNSEHDNFNPVLLHGYIQADLDDESDEDEFIQVPQPHDIPPSVQSVSTPASIEIDHSASEQEDSIPEYISSDDEPFHTDYTNWWDDFQLQSQRVQLSASPTVNLPPSGTNSQQRLRSDTDPYFLLRAQLVSTDSSSLDSPNDLDQTITDDHSPPEQSRVFDFTAALDALNAEVPDHVVNLQNLPPPTNLPRTSRNTIRHDYKSLHKHGFSK